MLLSHNSAKETGKEFKMPEKNKLPSWFAYHPDVINYEICETRIMHEKINGWKRIYYAIRHIFQPLNGKFCEVIIDEMGNNRVIKKIESICFREQFGSIPFVLGCLLPKYYASDTQFDEDNCATQFSPGAPGVSLALPGDLDCHPGQSHSIWVREDRVIIMLSDEDVQVYKKHAFEEKIPLVFKILQHHHILETSQKPLPKNLKQEKTADMEALLRQDENTTPTKKKQSTPKITTKKNQKMLSLKKDMIFLYKKSIEQLKKCSNDMKGYAPRTAKKTIDKTIKEVQNIDASINTKTKEAEKAYPDIASSEDFKQCWEELKTAHQQFEQQYQSFLERQHPIEESFCYEPQGAQDTNFNVNNLYYTHYRNGDVSKWRCTLFQYPKRAVSSIRHQTEGHDDAARNVIIQFQSDFQR